MHRLAMWLLWVFVMTVPLEYVVQLGAMGSISRLVGVLCFGVAILAVARRQRVRSLGRLHGVMAAFLVWGAISYFWSLDPSLSVGRIVTYLQVAMMVWLFWEIARSENDLKRLMQAFVLGAAIAAIGSIVTSLVGGVSSAFDRSSSFGADPNDQALTFSLAVPLAWSLASDSATNRLAAGLYRGYVALAVLGVLLSGSRGGVLAMASALSIIVTSSSRLTVRQRVTLLLGFGLTAGVARTLVPENVWQRIMSIGTELSRGSLSGRTYIWEAGLQLFFEHPVLGIGVGAFGSGVVRQIGDSFLAHNTFLSVLAEQGFVGLVLFLTMLGSLAYQAFRLPTELRRVWLTLLVVWAVGVSSLTWEYRKPTWILFAFVVGQIAVCLGGHRSHSEPSKQQPQHPSAIGGDMKPL